MSRAENLARLEGEPAFRELRTDIEGRKIVAVVVVPCCERPGCDGTAVDFVLDDGTALRSFTAVEVEIGAHDVPALLASRAAAKGGAN